MAALALGVGLASGLAGAESRAQLVDYETSARAAQVRQDAAWRLASPPALSVLQQTVGQLRGAASPALQAQADALIAAAAKQPEPEARRTLWRAVTLLT